MSLLLVGGKLSGTDLGKEKGVEYFRRGFGRAKSLISSQERFHMKAVGL